MTLRRWTLALAAIAGLASPALAAEPAHKPAPKLIVAISVDQFSANLFNQYRSRFTGGLRVMEDQGLVYANGYQSHSGTETCPGHSTILTGKHPNKTGIPANDWFDPVTGQFTYCLAAPQNTLAGGVTGGNGPVGPDNLRATTLGDWLKDSGAPGRVFAISGKDRGAIVMAGHKGDGVYWFREGFGFTTYVEPGQNDADRLKPVLSLNADIKARFAAKAPSWSYENDYCRTLEDDFKVGETSVHSTVPPAKFTFDNSPLLDDVTIDGALYLINQQKLGAGQSTDILAISLSATDRIGHNYGTQGPEMCEQLFRLDANLQRLFDALQDVPGGAVVVLTADHGGADVPERSAERGFPQARRADRGILTRLNESLKAQFKLETDPAEFDGWGLFIVGKDHIRLPDPLRGKVAEAAVAFLSKEPDVAGVFTLDDLLKSPPPPRGKSPEEFTLKERATLSAVAGRSTDVILILQPGIAPLSAKPGGAISTHGSAWDYDRRVPILFWWPGATGQERFFPIDTTDIGPTLAHLIGVKPPADVDGRCLDLGGFDVPACPAEPAPVAAAQPAPEPVAATPATKGVRWPWTKPRT